MCFLHSDNVVTIVKILVVADKSKTINKIILTNKKHIMYYVKCQPHLNVKWLTFVPYLASQINTINKND